MAFTFKSGQSLNTASGWGGAPSTQTKTRRSRTVRGGATKAKEKAITKANNAKTVTVSAAPAAKVKKVVKAKAPAAPKTPVIQAPKVSAAPAAKIKAAPAKESFGVLKSDTAAKRDTTSATFIKDVAKRAIPKAITSISEPDALSARPKVDAASVREAAYEKAPKPKPAANIPPLIAKPNAFNAPKPTIPNYVEKALTPKVKPDLPVDKSVYEKLAAEGKEGGVLGKVSGIAKAIISDKYRNKDMSYNQAYWASRKAGGATQAEMAAEQKAIGMKKAYSGDVVVTESMKREAAEAMKPVKGEFPELLTKGVRTVDKETSGLFGEQQKKTLTYGDGAVITTKTTNPVIKTPLGELRLGDKKTTTYANGVEQYTQTGGDKYHVGAEVTGTDTPAHIADTTKIEPMDGLNTVEDVQNAIASTTDEKELASLHERLRSLMRAMRTRTKFGGLAIGQAETEATKLGGLRIK
jgi:hypothetical protein